jgi:CelD/BcsL family acetyltransferase involved in cellulose biosynthesis
LCSTYRDTMLLRTTGYDPAYRKHRVGIYLLMRVIEHACAEPQLRVLDFGPGDDAYKRHFSDASTEERNFLIYAPTPRAIGINATRTAILGAQAVARRAVDRTRLTDRLRTEWRNRLRTSRS